MNRDTPETLAERLDAIAEDLPQDYRRLAVEDAATLLRQLSHDLEEARAERDDARSLHIHTATDIAKQRDDALARITALEAENGKLKAALQPFANYACDPPCGCHNCEARALTSTPEPETEEAE